MLFSRFCKKSVVPALVLSLFLITLQAKTATTATSHVDVPSGGPEVPNALFEFGGAFYYVSDRYPENSLDTQSKIKFIIRKGKVNSSGNVEDVGEINRFSVAADYHKATCTATVFKEQVYLFFMKEHQVSDKKSYYTMHYVTSSDPDTTWNTNNGDNFNLCKYRSNNTKFQLTPYHSGRSTGDFGFKAVTLGNYLYLFYYFDGSIYYTKFDGNNWTDKVRLKTEESFSLSPKCYFFVTPYYKGKENEEMLCIGIKHDDSITLWKMDKNDNVSYRYQFGATHIKNNNAISGVVATLKDGLQYRETLHVFGYKDAYSTAISHYQIDLNNGSHNKAWEDLDIATQWNQGDAYFSPISATTVMTAKDDDTIQQHVVLLNYGYWSWFVNYSVVTSFESDLLKIVERSQKVDTGTGETKDTSCWTVLGVIEGCPPFSRNGNDSDKATSSVKIKKEESQSVECAVEYGVSVTASVSGEVEIVEASAKIEEAIKSSEKNTYKSTKTIEINFDNSQQNKDGKYGWMLISKPTLQNYTYHWSSQNGSEIFGTINETRVTETVVTFESYSLDNPPSGMKVRNLSSDLDYWQNVEKIEYDNFMQDDMEVIKADLRGVSQKASLKLSQSTVDNSSAKTTLEVSSKVGLFDLFSIEAEGSVDLNLSTKFQTDFSTTCEASLDLPSPEGTIEEYYQSLTIKPYWYVPKENAKLSDYSTQPYWISNQFAKSDSMPWCISWRVIESETASYNPTAQIDDLNGDQKSDLTLLSRANSSSTIDTISLDDKQNIEYKTLDSTNYGLKPITVGPFIANAIQCFWFIENETNKIVIGIIDITGEPIFNIIENSTLSSTQTLLAVGNYDSDTMSELIISDSNSEKLSIWNISQTAEHITIDVKNELNINWNQTLSFVSKLDLNGDQINDILLINQNSGKIQLFLMENLQVSQTGEIVLEADSRFGTSGDFNGDRKSDLLIIDNRNRIKLMLMNGLTTTNTVALRGAPKVKQWDIVGCGDYNGDGFSDIALKKNTKRDTGKNTLRLCYIQPKKGNPDILKVIRKKRFIIKN